MSQYVPGQPGPPTGDLSYLIQGTRGEVSTYLMKARARQRRLLTLAVVAGALATLFAGAPAVGGKALSGLVRRDIRPLKSGMAAAVHLRSPLLPGCSHRYSAVEIPES